MKIESKLFVITGAGSGIGREMTLQIIKKGGSVAGIDIHEKELKETASLIQSDQQQAFKGYTVDVSDHLRVNELPQEIAEQQGEVDALINNAGIIQPFVKVNDLEYTEIERIMNVNFYGVIYMTKVFLPRLLQRPEGYIVNVSSMGGFLPVPGQSIYGASKAAIKLMTEGLQLELRDTNIGVCLVLPGAVATNIMENSGVDLGVDTENSGDYKSLSAPKAAGIIISGIERSRERIFVGSDSKMMDILYRISPSFAMKMIYKQMKGLLK